MNFGKQQSSSELKSLKEQKSVLQKKQQLISVASVSVSIDNFETEKNDN